MSASDKLKALPSDGSGITTLALALPQIVAVVEAAEHPYFWPSGFDPEPGAPWGDLRAALDALDKALDSSAPEVAHGIDPNYADSAE